MSTSKVERTRARLQKRIEEGAYYEAHQQLRVLCQRYVKAENYDAAIEILFTGARSLLQAGQGASGGDLCALLVEVYQAASLKPTATTKARVFTLISMISPAEPSRKKFIKDAVAWTANCGDAPAGDPELHHYVGSLYADEGETYEAERHLLVGIKSSADTLARVLYRAYKADQPDTAPHYLARAVLPYLLLRNLRDASRVYELFTKVLVQDNNGLVVQEVQSSTSEAKVFPSMPLMNFLGLLLAAVQRGGPDLFRTLKSHYAPYLKETSAWDDSLEQIGELYFGIRIQRPTNILDMMGSLFGGPQPSGGQGRTSSHSPAQIASPPSVDLD